MSRDHRAVVTYKHGSVDIHIRFQIQGFRNVAYELHTLEVWQRVESLVSMHFRLAIPKSLAHMYNIWDCNSDKSLTLSIARLCLVSMRMFFFCLQGSRAQIRLHHLLECDTPYVLTCVTFGIFISPCKEQERSDTISEVIRTQTLY